MPVERGGVRHASNQKLNVVKDLASQGAGKPVSLNLTDEEVTSKANIALRQQTGSLGRWTAWAPGFAPAVVGTAHPEELALPVSSNPNDAISNVQIHFYENTIVGTADIKTALGTTHVGAVVTLKVGGDGNLLLHVDKVSLGSLSLAGVLGDWILGYVNQNVNLDELPIKVSYVQTTGGQDRDFGE